MPPTFESIAPQMMSMLGPLEERRAMLYARYKKGWMGTAGAIAAGAVLALMSWGAGSLAAAIVLGVIGLISGATVSYIFVARPWNEYREAFKSQFIRNMVGSIAQDLHYEPTASITLEEYMASELYTTGVDRWQGEDLMYGKIGETEVRMSEMHTEYKTESTDNKGNKTTHWHTIFRGLFISADFHKFFHGKTFVRTDVAEKAFGNFGRMFQQPIFSGNQLIQLEDPEFEREFAVTATDQVEARYILSPGMMRKMLDMKKAFGAPVQFSFAYSRMFIAVPSTQNLFEPQFNASLSDPNYLRTFYQQVVGCAGIVEELGLNVRIWTKQ
jgi:hypothetical protein